MTTPCGSRCCQGSETAPTAGRGWTGCSATAWARGGSLTRTRTRGGPRRCCAHRWAHRGCRPRSARCACSLRRFCGRACTRAAIVLSPAELAELPSAITRRDGAALLHTAAGFVSEHRRIAQRWPPRHSASPPDGCSLSPASTTGVDLAIGLGLQLGHVAWSHRQPSGPRRAGPDRQRHRRTNGVTGGDSRGCRSRSTGSLRLRPHQSSS
jgi:hypothetical protein